VHVHTPQPNTPRREDATHLSRGEAQPVRSEVKQETKKEEPKNTHRFEDSAPPSREEPKATPQREAPKMQEEQREVPEDILRRILELDR